MVQFATGAIDTVRNDDWAYTRVLFRLYENRELRLIEWNDKNLIGHLIWPLPLLTFTGTSIRALHVAEALLALAGLASVYAIARRFLSEGYSLLVLGITAVFPAFVLHSSSYMTDIPALLAQMLCLLLAIIGLKQDSPRRIKFFYISMFAGVWAFTIREFGISALIAAIGGYLVTMAWSDKKQLIWSFVGIGSSIAFCLFFYFWRVRLPAPSSFTSTDMSTVVITLTLIDGMIRGFFTLALGVFPASLIVVARLGTRLNKLTLSVGAIVALFTFLWLFADQTILLSNTIHATGYLSNGVIIGSRTAIVSPLTWRIFEMFTAVAGICLTLAIISLVSAGGDVRNLISQAKTSGRSFILCLYFVTQIACFAAAALLRGQAPFDRYLIVLVPVSAILLLRSLANSPARPSGVLILGVATTFAVLFLTSSLLLLNAAAFDVARWQAGRAMMAQGYAATAIDAGYEWVGFHSADSAGENLSAAVWSEPKPWYSGLRFFQGSGNCIIVSSSALSFANLRLLEMRSYRTFAFWGSSDLFIYRNDPSCAAMRGPTG